MKILYDTTTQTFLPTYPRDDDAPIEGLDPRFEIYEVISMTEPGVSGAQYLERTETADHEAKTLTLGWKVCECPASPVVVPFRALAFALLQAGLYERAKAAALSTAEGEIWWTTAQSTTVQRDHPFVVQLGSALGQTNEQIDAIFAAAAALQ